MNSVPEKISLLKQTIFASLLPVRFSVLLVLAEEFIPQQKWCRKSEISNERR